MRRDRGVRVRRNEQIRLAVLDGKNYEEIAKAHGVSYTTVVLVAKAAISPEYRRVLANKKRGDSIRKAWAERPKATGAIIAKPEPPPKPKAVAPKPVYVDSGFIRPIPLARLMAGHA